MYWKLTVVFYLIWNVTLEYRTTHFKVLGQTWSGNSSPTSHTHSEHSTLKCCYGGMVRQKLGRKYTVPAESWTRDLWCANPGGDVMFCVCGMAFLCGSTLVTVPLLQAGTIEIWPQMFKSNVKPQQTEKLEMCRVQNVYTHIICNGWFGYITYGFYWFWNYIEWILYMID